MQNGNAHIRALAIKVGGGIIVAATVSFAASYLGNTTAQAEMRKDIVALQQWQAEIKEWQKDLYRRQIEDAEFRGKVYQRLDAIESVLARIAAQIERKYAR